MLVKETKEHLHSPTIGITQRRSLLDAQKQRNEIIEGESPTTAYFGLKIILHVGTFNADSVGYGLAELQSLPFIRVSQQVLGLVVCFVCSAVVDVVCKAIIDCRKLKRKGETRGKPEDKISS